MAIRTISPFVANLERQLKLPFNHPDLNPVAVIKESIKEIETRDEFINQVQSALEVYRKPPDNEPLGAEQIIQYLELAVNRYKGKTEARQHLIQVDKSALDRTECSAL